MMATQKISLEWREGKGSNGSYFSSRHGKLIAVVSRKYTSSAELSWVWWVRRESSIDYLAKGRGVATEAAAKMAAARCIRQLLRDWPGAAGDPVRPFNWGV